MSYMTKADEAEYAERSKTDPRDWMQGTVLECPSCRSGDVAWIWAVARTTRPHYECIQCGCESYDIPADERV